MTDSKAYLGLSYGGHDTAAALVRDGRILAACEQERYSLDKHSRRFPIDALRDCLRIAGLGLEDVAEIALTFDPRMIIREKYLRPALADDARIEFLLNDVPRIRELARMEEIVRAETGFAGQIVFHEHHLCHLASAWVPSGFEDCLAVSLDGMGEFETGMMARCADGEITPLWRDTRYPHSLGLLYSALTFWLGWRNHCDEGIVMGLAPFGDPEALIPGDTRSYIDVFREILVETGPYDYEVDQSWFVYGRVRDTWVGERFRALFGEKRGADEEVTDHHRNVAAALQRRLEEVVLAQLRRAREEFGLSRLCLAGGVALNCSMNGRIEAARIFDEIFVMPASGDSGTTVGAALLSEARRRGGLVPLEQHDFALGYRADEDEIAAAFVDAGVLAARSGEVAEETARHLAEGRIVAWYQGGAEFGPRALGHRSILTRPFPESMRDHLNARVKFREEFRPFAPAVLEEKASEWFTLGQRSRHMLMASSVRPEKAHAIPAVVHVDGSARVQTVPEETNPPFRALLEAFAALTGVPVLLNTSFNVKGQPIVNTPAQAVQTFLSTNIDVLVVGSWVAVKSAQKPDDRVAVWSAEQTA